MRVRTTWRKTRRAADDFVVDEMDPSVSMNPPADKYEIGGPSDFMEDVDDSHHWKDEYDEDGNTMTNEIGYPEFLSTTFSASDDDVDDSDQLTLDDAEDVVAEEESTEDLEKKASICIRVASAMLPHASGRMIEDQAVSLMSLSETDLFDTYVRLAADKEDTVPKKVDGIPDWCPKDKDELEKLKAIKDKEDKKEPSEKKASLEEMIAQMVQDELAQQGVSQQQIQEPVSQQQIQEPISQQQIQEPVSQQQIQEPVSQQQIQEMVAQMVQNQLGQQSAGQEDIQFDDEGDIQMDAPIMDNSELEPDEDLQVLFASKPATRTVGTKPAHGVSKLSGVSTKQASSKAEALEDLWKSAPDVKDAFGLSS